jgi:serine protease Do
MQSAGVGSGVIVSADGYVLTNNHVVQNADELEVELSDGRKFNGKVVGTDDRSDVAVVKIEATDLTPAKLGDSSLMDVGDWVIAVGSPFELDQTVTAGIISALNRSVAILPYEDFLQTDAAINPGNSGGPLVNLRGEVIGINTAINSRTGSNAGVGFAIPSSMAKQIMDSILTNGRVVRGFIGAVLGDVANNPEVARKLPGNYRGGAIIESVSPKDPADKAGLKAGDVIVKIDGKPLRDGRALKTRVALTPVGQVIKMTALRDGKEVEIGVRIEEQTDDKMNRLSGVVKIAEWGIEARRLDSTLAERLRMDPRLRGVLIISISRNGKAAEYGLEPGDVIRKINNRDIASPEELQAAIKSGKPMRLILRRGNQNAMLDVEP